VFDLKRGRAYTQGGGGIVAIDVVKREVLALWPAGCSSSHGIPVVDEERGFVFAGCSSTGGGVVLDANDGHRIAGYETGGGSALMGYSASLGHFYLRGDPGEPVAILGVCANGQMTPLATAMASDHGHGVTADDRGHIWVCDGTTGGLIRFTDPFPAAH